MARGEPDEIWAYRTKILMLRVFGADIQYRPEIYILDLGLSPTALGDNSEAPRASPREWGGLVSHRSLFNLSKYSGWFPLHRLKRVSTAIDQIRPELETREMTYFVSVNDQT